MQKFIPGLIELNLSSRMFPHPRKYWAPYKFQGMEFAAAQVTEGSVLFLDKTGMDDLELFGGIINTENIYGGTDINPN